jgi:dTDP-4-amino-4,6-dideoxygalactose transaminase
MIPFGDLSRQYNGMKKQMDQAWKEVSGSGWFVLGDQVSAFEKEFAAYLGVPYAVGVGNGTEALHLALAAFGVTLGDEVITVPNTAIPTLNAISAAGAKPVLVDIDPKTFTMDTKQIEKKITRRTKAILPVHLYGHCADMDPILKTAKKHDLLVVEDACQAHGAEYKGKKAGGLSPIGCFSFYPSKNLGAYGDGGMVVTKSKTYASQLRLLRNYGQRKKYHHTIKGFNSRLDELQAAILRKKLNKLETWNTRRRQLAKRYSTALKGLPIVLPAEAPWARHCFHLYVIRIQKRNELMDWLFRKGIQTQIHYPIPVHQQGAYRDLKILPGTFPEAERACRQILSLPLYPELKDEEQEKVIKAVRAFFRN